MPRSSTCPNMAENLRYQRKLRHLSVWTAREKRTESHVFVCDKRGIAASHRQTQPGVPSPSAPEAPGGGPFKSAIAERHVRISIRMLALREFPYFHADLPSFCFALFFCAAPSLFSPAWADNKSGWPFFSPNIVFWRKNKLAQKTGFCAGFCAARAAF